MWGMKGLGVGQPSVWLQQNGTVCRVEQSTSVACGACRVDGQIGNESGLHSAVG